MSRSAIVLAGATGDLGGRIAAALRRRGAPVRALVRGRSAPDAVARLRHGGVEIAEVDYDEAAGLSRACEGASCVVSALSGLRDVIVGQQTRLLDAAVAAGVPRFVPSDFSIDYARLPAGDNHNLDLRREFNARLDRAPIAATSILNGMFAELLTAEAPVVLQRVRRVLHWGDADQAMDFTTKGDVAEFTAEVALDRATPRVLRIAGDVRSARGLAASATEATGRPFGLLRPGGLRAFRAVIRLARTVAPGRDELYPAWQGMQYLHDMLSGLPKLEPLDNRRYPELRWTSVREVLAEARVRD